jgi:flagellar hook assembly protein FlgD
VVLPNVTAMSLAAPNPFQGSTSLGFDLAQPSRVELAIFSVDGRLVRTLVDGIREAGEYRPAWDGRDTHGSRAAPGVYYVRLLAGPKRFTRQVVLL